VTRHKEILLLLLLIIIIELSRISSAPAQIRPANLLHTALVFCNRQSGKPTMNTTGVLQDHRKRLVKVDWQIADWLTTLLGQFQLDTMYVAV
jgi:hypothetical protein